MNYKLAYAIGFHPWEDLADHPPFADKLLELVAREEDGRPAIRQRRSTSGPAAASGASGSPSEAGRLPASTSSRALAPRPRAIRGGRRRDGPHAGRCDRAAGGGRRLRFPLLVDTGTFHGLSEAQREAMGREVSAVAAPDATVILDCFVPRRRGPLPRGASQAEVERAFPVGDHRRRGGGHRARRDRATLQIRRALLPAEEKLKWC